MAIILNKSVEEVSNSEARIILRQLIDNFVSTKGISTPLNTILEVYFFQLVSKVL